MSDKKYNGIAIFGGMGSGKDTLAEILLQSKENSAIYNIGYICREFMKISKVNKRWENKSRELSQTVASKLREIDANILNDYTYANAIFNSEFPIIVGGRTFKDFEYWKEKGFLLVGITADYNTRVERLLSRDSEFNKEDLNHETEKDTDYISKELCKIVISNNKDLNHLYSEIGKIIKLF